MKYLFQEEKEVVEEWRIREEAPFELSPTLQVRLSFWGGVRTPIRARCSQLVRFNSHFTGLVGS